MDDLTKELKELEERRTLLLTQMQSIKTRRLIKKYAGKYFVNSKGVRDEYIYVKGVDCLGVVTYLSVTDKFMGYVVSGSLVGKQLKPISQDKFDSIARNLMRNIIELYEK